MCVIFTTILKKNTVGHNDIASIHDSYERSTECHEAFLRYVNQGHATQRVKPVKFENSVRIYVEGRDTLLSPQQQAEKQQLEDNLENRVRTLKIRMSQASLTRRQVLKGKGALRVQIQVEGQRYEHPSPLFNLSK